MIQITSRPRKNVLNTNISNWTAGHNPVIYTLQREDLRIVSITSGLGSKAQITFFDDISLLVEIGNFMYVSSGPYVGVTEVIDVINGGTTILTDLDFQVGTSTGFVNLKQNYSVLCDVYEWKTNKKLTKNSLRFTGNIEGFIEIDFSSLLQSFFTYDNDFDYPESEAKKDTNNSFGFYIKVVEIYKNKDLYETIENQTILNDNLNPTFTTNSAKQYQDLYGQNMGEYLTFPNLYPVLDIVGDGTVSFNRFSYSVKYDYYLVATQGGGLFLLDYQNGSVLKKIDTSSFLPNQTGIDVFDDENQIAISGSDTSGETITVFFSLSDYVENEILTEIWRYQTGEFSDFTFQKKLRNFLYSSFQGSTCLLYQYDVLNQTVKLINVEAYAIFDITIYNNILACSIPAAPSGFSGVYYYNSIVFEKIGEFEIVDYPTAVSFNNKGELYFFTSNQKLRKLNTNQQITTSNIVFTGFPNFIIIAENENENKAYIGDTGKIILFDINTLEEIETYQNNSITVSLFQDFKMFENRVSLGSQSLVGISMTASFILLQVYQDKLAKYLTPFDTVNYWVDFPFDLSYIYSEKLTKYQTFKRDVFYNRDNQILETKDTLISTNNLGTINRTNFKNISADACFIETQIINIGEEIRDYASSDYSTQDYN